MKFDLTNEQKAIREMACNIAKTLIDPAAAKMDEERDRETFLKILRQLAQLGLAGINIKSRYGGSEAGMVAFSLAMTELGRACAATADTVSVTNMVSEVIQSTGTEEQKENYIPKLCSGEYYAGSFALTESASGSDAASMRLNAAADGNDWVLNGTKTFITSAEYSGLFIVWAVTDSKAPKGKGISTFLVEGGTKGLKVGKNERKMGQNIASTNELVFEECRIPQTALLGRLNEGFRLAVTGLAGGRIGVGSLALGVGLAAMDYATRYAKERKQFGRPISNFQAIQWMIAESYTELEAARLLLLNAAYHCEQGRYFGSESAMAKYFATKAAERACYNALQMLGGYGYTKDYPIERYTRDVRITSIYEGTTEILKMLIARDILSKTQ